MTFFYFITHSITEYCPAVRPVTSLFLCFLWSVPLRFSQTLSGYSWLLLSVYYWLFPEYTAAGCDICSSGMSFRLLEVTFKILKWDRTALQSLIPVVRSRSIEKWEMLSHVWTGTPWKWKSAMTVYNVQGLKCVHRFFCIMFLLW